MYQQNSQQGSCQLSPAQSPDIPPPGPHQRRNSFIVEPTENGSMRMTHATDKFPDRPSNYGLEYNPNPVNSACPMDPINRSNRSLDKYGIRAPQMPLQSTPINSYNLPSHETCGSQIDYNLSWMPQDVELPDLVEPGIGGQRFGLPSKYLQRDPNMNLTDSSTIDTRFFEQSSDITSGFFDSKQKGGSPTNSPTKKSSKRESVLEWFDRTVEKELQKRRAGSLNVGENLVNLETPTSVKEKFPSRASKSLLLEASTSGIDIASKLCAEQGNDLQEAVDKLAKAEAIITFEGAVKAAEEAAAAAPPEFAEEAAAARARDFQAELTGVVKHEFAGSKPVEVIGYVGITRPKKPKKSISNNNNNNNSCSC